MDTTKPNQLLRLADVSSLTSLGKSTINLWVAQGKFPAPTAISPTIKVWRQRDVEEWIENVFSKAPVYPNTTSGHATSVIALLPNGDTGGDAFENHATPLLPYEQQAGRP